MGQSIGWYRFSEDKSKHAWATDLPDHFDARFAGRWDYYFAIYDVPHERTSNDDEGMIRPTDFSAFRAKLGTMLQPDADGDNIFRDMTDWLETHPDVYVEYS